MTNLQRAVIKAFVMKDRGLNAAKWNGNQLVGKWKNDKKWQTILSDDTEAEAMYNKATKGLV